MSKTTGRMRRIPFRGLGGFRPPHIRFVKPSSVPITLLLILTSIFILSGGIYDIMEKPLAVMPGSEQYWTFYVPRDISRQTLNESLIALFLYVAGISGFFIAYRSTRYVYRPRQASILLLIGTVMIVLAFFGGLYVLGQKMAG
ncbi:hypothetical protein KEJ26_05985 [Candidatus Bathyarchaeota archaeon]|nr:hypothetical protein [Candidatus Bathyarchaeota archaeon]